MENINAKNVAKLSKAESSSDLFKFSGVSANKLIENIKTKSIIQKELKWYYSSTSLENNSNKSSFISFSSNKVPIATHRKYYAPKKQLINQSNVKVIARIRPLNKCENVFNLLIYFK